MRIAVVAVCLAGCSGDPSCEELAEWGIAVSRAGTEAEGADAKAGRAPDGTLFIGINDTSGGGVRFGDRMLDGPHVAHVSADGNVLAVSAAPEAGTRYPGALRGDDLGNVVAAWAGPTSIVLAGYTADLQRRWTYEAAGSGYAFFGPSPGSPLDVGPSGETVLLVTAANQTRLLYLTADGVERWVVPIEPSNGVVRIADNADVFLFRASMTGTWRTRYAAATGVTSDEIQVSTLPEAIERDGSFVSSGYAPDGSSFVRRFDASGAPSWEQSFEARSFNNPVLATTGDVIGQTSYEGGAGGPHYKLLVLDGATGERRHEVAMCSHLTVVGADAERYVGLGLTGSTSIGLASFAMP